jgi:broad specificity phosphatase PhoE
MRVVIVRHGNTFAPGEPPRRIGARTDLPLVASGRAQAEALRLHFAALGWRFDRILSSPLQRTRETAALIAPGRAIEDADWLREIDHGPDENRTEEEVLARIGADALETWEHDAIPPPGWQVDAEARLAAWRTLFEQESDETWLLTTSNGAARFALLALGERPAKIRTGAYGLVQSGPWRTAAWDQRPGESPA